MRRALVVGAAPIADAGDFYPALLRTFDLVIAADAAGEWCASLGRLPDVVVGDFDSAAAGAEDRLRASGAAVVRLPREKDVSDLDAAVDTALASGATSVTLTAAFSDRPDHTMSAFGSLLRAGARMPADAREPGWTASAVSAGHPFDAVLTPGTVFSVVSPAGARGVTISGARFTLEAADLDPLSSRGVSNEATGDRANVRVTEGMLIVVVLTEGPPA